MTSQRMVFATGLFALFCMVLGCGRQTSTTAQSPVKKEPLEQKVDRLQRELYVLKAQVDNLNNTPAYVDTVDKGYAIAQTEYGAFAVSCSTLSPYLDGYKVSVDVGNLTNAMLRGAKIRLHWGEDLSKIKEFRVVNTFPPGRITKLELIMTPAKPEEIKTFAIAFDDFDQLAFYR
ncbi:MAG: hypothetical protein A4E65_00992 [Syntrophorhabdus sp. PtaU1.Bin153]|nr:MAG: hypothetical protein A4E65_00992 [Syntrophorhabdus sp. PtaU1.Bin153]